MKKDKKEKKVIELDLLNTETSELLNWL